MYLVLQHSHLGGVVAPESLDLDGFVAELFVLDDLDLPVFVVAESHQLIPELVELLFGTDVSEFLLVSQSVEGSAQCFSLSDLFLQQ